MTFKTALFISVTPEGGPLAWKVKSRGVVPHGIFCPFWTIWGPLVLRSNNKYLNKIVAKIQHLNAETYANEQVPKIFIQNFS